MMRPSVASWNSTLVEAPNSPIREPSCLWARIFALSSGTTSESSRAVASPSRSSASTVLFETESSQTSPSSVTPAVSSILVSLLLCGAASALVDEA